MFSALNALALCAAPARASDLVFTEQSSIVFHNSATLGDFAGRAPFTGTVDPVALTGSVDVPTAGLITGSGPRDARLQSYCLEASRFAHITFRATSITGDTKTLRTGAGAGSITLTGPLTIRDVTRTVSVPAAFSYAGDELRLSGRVDLLWSDYGVPDPSIVISALDPAMYVTFDLIAR